MYRPCLMAVVTAVLFAVSQTAHARNITITDEGCFDGGAMFDYQIIHRIVIWEDNNVSYLEEIPCGSGNWYERGVVLPYPYSGGTGTTGTLTSSGTIEFTASPNRAGIVTAGTGPDGRGFEWLPTSGKFIISAPVVESLLTSFN